MVRLVGRAGDSAAASCSWTRSAGVSGDSARLGHRDRIWRTSAASAWLAAILALLSTVAVAIGDQQVSMLATVLIYRIAAGRHVP